MPSPEELLLPEPPTGSSRQLFCFQPAKLLPIFREPAGTAAGGFDDGVDDCTKIDPATGLISTPVMSVPVNVFEGLPPFKPSARSGAVEGGAPQVNVLRL